MTFKYPHDDLTFFGNKYFLFGLASFLKYNAVICRRRSINMLYAEAKSSMITTL